MNENEARQKQEAQVQVPEYDWHKTLAFYTEIMAACVEEADVIAGISKSKLDATALALKLFDRMTTPDYRAVLFDSFARLTDALAPEAFQDGAGGDIFGGHTVRVDPQQPPQPQQPPLKTDAPTTGGDSGHN